LRVDFHSGVTDKLGHACRLLRKAVRQGARVQVCGDAHELDALDQALWTFDPQDFIPHLRWRTHDAPPPALHRTPVWLVETGQPWPDGLARPAVLVNLGPQPPQAPDLSPAVARVVEIVGHDPAEVEAGRRRWRHYAQRGLEPAHHKFTRESA
jgi:DNA polymerase-3 subunit chi